MILPFQKLLLAGIPQIPVPQRPSCARVALDTGIGTGEGVPGEPGDHCPDPLQCSHARERPTRAMDGPNIHVGRIDLDAMQRLLPSKAYDFYVCGPPAMMDTVTRGLQAWG